MYYRWWDWVLLALVVLLTTWICAGIVLRWQMDPLDVLDVILQWLENASHLFDRSAAQ